MLSSTSTIANNNTAGTTETEVCDDLLNNNNNNISNATSDPQMTSSSTLPLTTSPCHKRVNNKCDIRGSNSLASYKQAKRVNKKSTASKSR